MMISLSHWGLVYVAKTMQTIDWLYPDMNDVNFENPILPIVDSSEFGLD